MAAVEAQGNDDDDDRLGAELKAAMLDDEEA